MTIKINHFKFFLHALRTAILFIAGFLSYELLKALENEWNIKYPNNEIIHFSQRKLYHFIIIYIIDLLVLYSIIFLFNVHL
jgi:hypothetical protein